MKILVLTSVYKDYSLSSKDKSTIVVNEFAEEWSKNNEVVVVQNAHRYPLFFHILPKFIRSFATKFLKFYIPDLSCVRRKEYFQRNVVVYREPIKRIIPHSSPSMRRVRSQTKRIIALMKRKDFRPDIILCHWASPQMEIALHLKKEFDCKLSIVFHGLDYINNKRFWPLRFIDSFEYVGCRSETQAASIKCALNLKKEPFVCYSGIPDHYLRNFSANFNKFKKTDPLIVTYVGRLIKYKNVDCVIKALSSIDGKKWHLNIVGDGVEKKGLKKMAKRLKCENNITFYGRIKRDDVMDILKESHVFAMVSDNEVYGLAYLEAMASCCITIASKNSGVDGIIKDKVNGYLCEQGNDLELNKIIKTILEKDFVSLETLAQNGFNTVQNYSNSVVARKYLDIISK